MEHLEGIRSFPNLYYDDFFSAFLVFLLENHISDMWAFAQSLDDQSFASSTICMHDDEPCRTMVAERINHAVLRNAKY
jgi:hypothetical protein